MLIFKWKQRRDSTGSRTIEPLFKFKYFLGFFYYCHHVIYSRRVRPRLRIIHKGEYTYLGPLRGHMYHLCMLCNMNLTPQLTFPFEFSSMTYLFKFDNLLQGLVSIYATKIYEDITLKFINQNSTPCLVLIEEYNFNLSTMLNLKQSMNTRYIICIQSRAYK